MVSMSILILVACVTGSISAILVLLVKRQPAKKQPLSQWVEEKLHAAAGFYPVELVQKISAMNDKLGQFERNINIIKGIRQSLLNMKAFTTNESMYINVISKLDLIILDASEVYRNVKYVVDTFQESHSFMINNSIPRLSAANKVLPEFLLNVENIENMFNQKFTALEEVVKSGSNLVTHMKESNNNNTLS